MTRPGRAKGYRGYSIKEPAAFEHRALAKADPGKRVIDPRAVAFEFGGVILRIVKR